MKSGSCPLITKLGLLSMLESKNDTKRLKFRDIWSLALFKSGSYAFNVCTSSMKLYAKSNK